MTSERAIPRLSAYFAMIWGLFVVNPYTDVFARTPSIYRPMLEIVPYEVFWGGLILAVGLSAERLNARGYLAAASVVIAVPAFAFAVLYLMSDIAAPAWALWGCIGAYNWAIFWERRGQCFQRYQKA